MITSTAGVPILTRSVARLAIVSKDFSTYYVPKITGCGGHVVQHIHEFPDKFLIFGDEEKQIVISEISKDCPILVDYYVLSEKDHFETPPDHILKQDFGQLKKGTILKWSVDPTGFKPQSDQASGVLEHSFVVGNTEFFDVHDRNLKADLKSMPLSETTIRVKLDPIELKMAIAGFSELKYTISIDNPNGTCLFINTIEKDVVHTHWADDTEVQELTGYQLIDLVQSLK